MTPSEFRARYLAATQGGEVSDYLPPAFTPSEVAKLMKGEVVSKTDVRCPSPSHDLQDRSCLIRLDATGQPYVYDCVGHRAAVLKALYEAAGVEPPKPAGPASVESLWRETAQAAGTVVEGYLRSRGITLPLPACLRFHPGLRHVDRSRWPGMVAERVDTRGSRSALHRTFLRPDGSGKAPVDPPRMELGPKRGTAIRLAEAANTLVVGEGIETVLSFMQSAGSPGWAAGSATDLRGLVLPPEVRHVLIAADGDDPGRSAARAAAARWQGEGRRVTIFPAPDGKDFNDILLGMARHDG